MNRNAELGELSRSPAYHVVKFTTARRAADQVDLASRRAVLLINRHLMAAPRCSQRRLEPSRSGADHQHLFRDRCLGKLVGTPAAFIAHRRILSANRGPLIPVAEATLARADAGADIVELAGPGLADNLGIGDSGARKAH